MVSLQKCSLTTDITPMQDRDSGPQGKLIIDSPGWPDDLVMKNTDLVHLPSAVLTFNKPVEEEVGKTGYSETSQAQQQGWDHSQFTQ